jgi:hypothetical protein
MRFDNIGCILAKIIDGKFSVCSDEPLRQEIEQSIGKNSSYMEVFRIIRTNNKNAKRKTLIFADLSEVEMKEKLQFKEILRSTALIKEILPGTENVDIYLFIAFSNQMTIDERIRIEATEQLCRKYVLLPNEDIESFFERTFLSKIVEEKAQINGKDPLDRAFSNIKKDYVWLSDEIEEEWKKYFLEDSGSDIAEKILYGVMNDGSVR